MLLSPSCSETKSLSFYFTFFAYYAVSRLKEMDPSSSWDGFGDNEEHRPSSTNPPSFFADDEESEHETKPIEAYFGGDEVES